MAHKRSGKPPHKVGDRPGLRFRFDSELQQIRIGPDITVTICKEAGHLVSYTKAPRELQVVVESSCKKAAKRNN